MASKPRIITLTVERLKNLAARLESTDDVPAPGDAAATLRAYAKDLDEGADGRETQEKRKKGKARR